MFAAILTSCTSAHSGHRFSVLVCLLLFLLNAFSLLHLSSISSVQALEEEEYSVASLLPSFKTLMFWRADRTTEEKLPILEEAASALDHVSYQVSDVKPIDRTEENGEVHTDENERFSLESIHAEVEQKPKNFHFAKKRLLANSKDNRICHSCGKSDFFLDEDEEYRQRIEFIKEQILTRLGMKRPPNLRSQPDIDYSMYMRIAENTINQRELTDFTGQPRSSDSELVEEVDKAFILPSRRDLKTPVFDLSTVDTADNTKVIKSMYILVKYNLTEYYYRTLHDDTDLNIASEPSEENDISRSSQKLSTVSPMKQSHDNIEANFDSAHWYQYDVTTLLSDYSGKMIRIYNQNFDILSSVIMIEMTNNKFTRAKRSIDCTDKVSFCCRQHFYVNFTTIGWNNWIFQPSGYNANYCKGKCDLSHARYHHTTVIGKYPAIKLCCSPREMSSISLIYMDDKFNIYQKNLPNMVVESCDCA